MKNNEYTTLAKQIRKEMTTPAAGVYQLQRLPKCATIETIANIVEALHIGNTYISKPIPDRVLKRKNALWYTIYQSKLYIDEGAAYTHISAHAYNVLKKVKIYDLM